MFGLALATVASATLAAPAPRIAEPSPPEARAALDRAAACIVAASPGVASEMLGSDFRSPIYRAKMDRLVDANRGCFEVKWLKANRLLMAGAMAEHLIERQSSPLNVRLAKAASSSPAKPLSATDAAAFCVSRSDPDGAAALLATAPGSDAETAAATALATALGLCWRGKSLELSPAALRSMVATASFRLLAAGES
jgi:hypothetical protein